MPHLTTHVLDTMHGEPAEGVAIRLFAAGDSARALAEATTDGAGRARMAPHDGLTSGYYDLVFAAGAYFSARGAPDGDLRFLDEVVIRFGFDARIGHCHLPLLLSPFGYTTYRGQ
ncbi:MAG: hydroxyisourate hydrolase [Acidiphilium sp.]